MAKKIAFTVFLGALGLAVLLLWRVAERTETVIEKKAPLSLSHVEDAVPIAPRVFSSRVAVAPSPTLPTNTTPAPEDPIAAPADAIPGEQVLMFYDAGHLRAFLDVAAEEGIDVVGQIGALNAVRIRVADKTQLRRARARTPTPIAHGPNLYVRRPDPPEPPEGITYSAFGSSAADWLGAAAERSQWGEGITVAVLDTAIVPGFAQGDVERIDLVNEPAGATPVGHGTAVASIITGADEVPGVAPGVDLLAVRVMGDSGTGNTFTLAQGVIDAVDRGARVINMSVGAAGDTPVLGQAIAYAQQHGAVVVAAAGNDGRDGILYPARYAGVLAVGAVDADGRQMYFSNRGARLDLVAPGLGVAAEGVDGEPVAFSGTSAATPFVAGAVAGVWSASPELSGSEVADLLIRYADDAGAPGHDTRYGAGILNVGRVFERNTPGLVDMVLAQPYIESNPSFPDELVVTLFGQNRGTEPLNRVVLRADVDGTPVDLTFYDVGVGAIVQHDLRLTRAGIGARMVSIEQDLSVIDAEDRTPRNNRMRSTLQIQTAITPATEGQQAEAPRTY